MFLIYQVMPSNTKIKAVVLANSTLIICDIFNNTKFCVYTKKFKNLFILLIHRKIKNTSASFSRH